MGLAAGFKQFVSARLPASVLPHEPESHAVLTDAPCVLHSFSCDEQDPIPAGHLLFMRLKREALEGVPRGGTAVVCFDRHKETPVEKHAAHKKRRHAKRQWTCDEVALLLEKDELPRGDDWNDLLASRTVRENVTSYLARRFENWFINEGGSERVKRLIIHNGGSDEPIVLEDGKRVQCDDAPRAGEADLALVLWASWIVKKDETVEVRRDIGSNSTNISHTFLTRASRSACSFEPSTRTSSRLRACTTLATAPCLSRTTWRSTASASAFLNSKTS